MEEVRATYKRRDAWWTVLLVDPIAGPLVRLVYPYRWITPNVLTLVSFMVGLGAAACFLAPTYGWVYLGALLFHLSFVVDCMDGKLARLRQQFNVMGAWLDFASDRLQFIICVFALMGGQYLRTHRPVYLVLATVVVALGLLRYLHSSVIDQLEDTVRRRIEAAYAAAGRPVPVASTDEPAGERAGSGELIARLGPVGRVKAFLNRHRIRVGLVSAIEFEMAVCIIAPLTGWLIGVPLVAGALLLLFEAFFVYRLRLAVRGMDRTLATLERPAAPAPAAAVPVPQAAIATDDAATYLPADHSAPAQPGVVPIPAPSPEQFPAPGPAPRPAPAPAATGPETDDAPQGTAPRSAPVGSTAPPPRG